MIQPSLRSEAYYSTEKSKFLSFCIPLSSQQEAREFLRELWKKHDKATHIVSAYRLGYAEPLGLFDDDGEPALTAGAPILSLLEERQITQVLIAVVRYFGGIKLGKGGLIRAYTRSALEAMEQNDFVEAKKVSKWELTYDYSHHALVEHLLRDVCRADIDYREKIRLQVYLQEEAILDLLREKSSDQIHMRRLGRMFITRGKEGMIEAEVEVEGDDQASIKI